jgi:hypothetical protein
LAAIALLAVVIPAQDSSAMPREPGLVALVASGGMEEEIVESIAVDSAGNAFVTGIFEGVADFDGDSSTVSDQRTSNGDADAFIASYDELGKYRWSVGFGGQLYDESYAIAVDNEGNSYVGGYFEGIGDFDGDPTTTADRRTSGGDGGGFVVSFDRDGNYRWVASISGPDYAEVRGLATDRAGNVYATGGSEGATDFDGDAATTDDRLPDTGSYDAFVASYQSDGRYRWALAAGGPEGDQGLGVATNGSGGVYVTGFFRGVAGFDGDDATTGDERTSPNGRRMFLASYDDNGSFQWATATGEGGSISSSAIATAGDGTSYLTGVLTGTGDFDGDDLTTDDQRSSIGTTSMFVASYDSTGGFQWATVAEANSGFINDITTDATGNIYVAGDFSGDLDVDTSATTTIRTAAGQSDVFVASYNAGGGSRWLYTAGGAGKEKDPSVAVASTDNVYIGGAFAAGDGTGGSDFDGDITTAGDQRTSNGDDDLFVARIAIADTDGDGFAGPLGGDTDCNDDDPAINPDADEIPYNGIDEDCDGEDLSDVDDDGFSASSAIGGEPDCNDDDPAINPDATEVPGDGIDQDCSGADASAELCNGLAVTIDLNVSPGASATSADDVILGTSGDDVINGLGGDDTICGEAGDDTINGGDGLDFIFGGEGNDTMIGGDGNDRIRGNQGEDMIDGQAGNDFLYGGIDADTITGGDGKDTIGGFGGADTINSGPGNDIIFGGFGADIIDAGAGNDTVNGLIGDDVITGGAGDDVLNGDQGRDTINGGDGDDVINGGNSLDTLFGDNGDDEVNGGKADDTLSGGVGQDTCAGNKDTDTADASCELQFGIP